MVKITMGGGQIEGVRGGEGRREGKKRGNGKHDRCKRRKDSRKFDEALSKADISSTASKLA